MAAIGDPDSGEESITADPDFAPINYQWFPRFEGDTVLKALDETLANIGLELPDVERFRGEIRATMAQLRRGGLEPLHGVKGPMRSEPRLQLFEVRCSYLARLSATKSREVHVRFYHLEPKRWARKGGSSVLGLHVHWKDIDSSTVDDEQDAEIAIAADRFYELKAEGKV
ncbi:hypothetical protein [Microbacterium sp. 3J1]|uniref:hypothetical protein n=1 Tax=Microbacterium sp. 3J1 TaxID=861269 RepID=UPI0011479EF8|nr:hypothetical protein [Microbacterium sp. 3J1]